MISRGWRRLGVQAAILVGLGFAAGVRVSPVSAEQPCWLETECTFKKPRLLFLLDASSAMNEAFAPGVTRWEAALEELVQALDFDNGYLPETHVLGLARYGHDPDPGQAGTPIAGDPSGLIDGVRLDVPWYDPDDPTKAYAQCDAGALHAALDGMSPPADGIGAWTRGALEFAAGLVAQADLDHPEDMGERRAVVMVVSQGLWTDSSGALTLEPAADDPSTTAAALLGAGIVSLVQVVGDDAGLAQGALLAAAGGSGTPVTDVFDGSNRAKERIEEIKQTIVPPKVGLPRVMVLLDASSSMLDAPDGVPGPGKHRWDWARAALAAEGSLLEHDDGSGFPLEGSTQFGLAVFGSSMPAEERVLVSYQGCNQEEFAWALDPASACEAPGCTDPYAAPPIAWTFKNGMEVDPPGFDAPVFNHMPGCQLSEDAPGQCFGSRSFLHRGLNEVRDHIAAYRAGCDELVGLHSCDEDTQFHNILIVDGPYDSTDTQVLAPLKIMFNAGVITHVIGLGDAVDPVQLGKLAGWGSGGALAPELVADQAALAAAMAAIVTAIPSHPCVSSFPCHLEGGDEGGISFGGSDGTGDDGTATTSSSSSGGDDGTAGGPTTDGAEASVGDDSSSVSVSVSATLTDSQGPDGEVPTTGQVPTTDETPTGGQGPGGPTSATGGAGDEDASTGSPGAIDEGGCGCTSRGSQGLAPLLVAMLALARRRRRSTGAQVEPR